MAPAGVLLKLKSLPIRTGWALVVREGPGLPGPFGSSAAYGRKPVVS
jgi:hypothetical protein